MQILMRGRSIKESNLLKYIILVVLIAVYMAIMPCLAVDENISAGDLTYIAEQHPPYSYEKNGLIQGISVNLLQKTWEDMNENLIAAPLRFCPGLRAMRRP
jgi:hypothetical protein